MLASLKRGFAQLHSNKLTHFRSSSKQKVAQCSVRPCSGVTVRAFGYFLATTLSQEQLRLRNSLAKAKAKKEEPRDEIRSRDREKKNAMMVGSQIVALRWNATDLVSAP